MKLRKLIVVVPIAGILAGIGMGIAAVAGGALSNPQPGTVADASPSPKLHAEPATTPTTPDDTYDEVVLGVSDARTAEESIRDKKRDAEQPATPPVDHPADTAKPAKPSTPKATSKPKTTSAAFTPWKKSVKVWKADTSAFCAGLSDLRKGAGKPKLASCTEASGPVSWAKKMAQTLKFKHDPSYSGSEVVGYSWSLQRILTGPNGFVNSSAHMGVIGKGGDGVKAKVGCYWSRVKEQKTKKGHIDTFEYIYCVARFSY